MIFTLEKDYSKYIKEMFPLDEELRSTYHIISGSSWDDICNRTIDDLTNYSKDLRFYTVKINEDVIGFFGTENNSEFLNTIFIKPEYRTSSIMFQFWNKLKEHFSHKSFYTGIYSKNTRALNFYIKNGASIINEQDLRGNKAYLLGVNICQQVD